MRPPPNRLDPKGLIQIKGSRFRGFKELRGKKLFYVLGVRFLVQPSAKSQELTAENRQVVRGYVLFMFTSVFKYPGLQTLQVKHNQIEGYQN